jgi:hypothetical protein
VNLTPRQRRIAGLACLFGAIGMALVLAIWVKEPPTVLAIATGLSFWIGVLLLLPGMTRR